MSWFTIKLYIFNICVNFLTAEKKNKYYINKKIKKTFGLQRIAEILD